MAVGMACGYHIILYRIASYHRQTGGPARFGLQRMVHTCCFCYTHYCNSQVPTSSQTLLGSWMQVRNAYTCIAHSFF